VLVAVSSGTVALAGNSGAKPSSSDVAATTAPAAGQTNPFDAAIQALVEEGTIDQAQADVLRRQIDAGSIDEQELIDSGVLTPAQMQGVQARLTTVKQSMAAASVSEELTPDKVQPTDSPATNSVDARRAEKEAAAASQASTPEKAQPTSSSPTK
jgi:hypothetical protein